MKKLCSIAKTLIPKNYMTVKLLRIEQFSIESRKIIGFAFTTLDDWLENTRATFSSNFILLYERERESYGLTNKQLLDEVEHDIMNYQNRGLCYLAKPKAEADNTDTRF